MAALQFELNDYLAYICTSNNKKLLVEGPDDKRVFDRLIDKFDRKRNQVDVDDASLIGFEQPLGNREKVELICKIMRGSENEEKLVGFVDREFRGFLWDPELVDEFKCHWVDGRLIWTRGHSIENYFFDFDTLYQPFATLSPTDYYRIASDMFEKNLSSVLRLACAASLSGMEFGNYQLIRSVISWSIFEIVEDKISINFSRLITSLREKNLPENTISGIIARFEFWIPLTFEADIEVIRWMCHGHLGLSFIWASFQKMVYEACNRNSKGNEDPEREVSHALNVREEHRFLSCATKWSERSIGNECVFPNEVIKMLELT